MGGDRWAYNRKNITCGRKNMEKLECYIIIRLELEQFVIHVYPGIGKCTLCIQLKVLIRRKELKGCRM